MFYALCYLVVCLAIFASSIIFSLYVDRVVRLNDLGVLFLVSFIPVANVIFFIFLIMETFKKFCDNHKNPVIFSIKKKDKSEEEKAS